MLADRYGLAVSTASPAARDAYVAGCDLLFAVYPGASEAFDRALAADEGFALAHVAQAYRHLMAGNTDAARHCMGAAESFAAGLSAREASHIAFFRLLVGGEAAAALAAARVHLAAWPCDAMVLSTTANPNGLIGSSGLAGQKHDQVALMDALAPHYGDDWWFNGHYGLALVEIGQRDAGQRKIERSLAQNPNNAYGAHSQAHLYYEDGDAQAACEFLRSWLAQYPREGFLYSHLAWHLALGELEIGDAGSAFRRFNECLKPTVHSGSPRMCVTDGVAFLWRAELAGHARDAEQWRALHEFARQALPHATMALADVHAVLAEAVAGDTLGLTARVSEIGERVRAGRYPSGPVVPALARAFDAFLRDDFTAAIDAMEPILEQRERIGGSMAQTDLVEFTLLRAYIEAGRTDDANCLLMRRRTGHAAAPVAGLGSLH